MLRRRPASLRPRSWSATGLEPRLLLAGDAGVAVTQACSPAAESAGSADTVARSPVSDWCLDYLDYAAASEIAFLDAGLDAHDPDVAAAMAQIARSDVEVVLIDSAGDGLEQIESTLARRRGIRAVHLVSHGSDGQIRLGNSVIDEASITRNAETLRRWANSLAADADVLVYGCDVAATSRGEAFLSRLATLTGADVAASTDRTGTATRRGDWNFEFATGAIEADLLASTQQLRSLNIVLPITIRAAGSEGDESMSLRVDGSLAQSFNEVGTDFQTFTFDGDVSDAQQIRIEFANDLYLPGQGIDRNLMVDWIEVDGVRIETESPDVFASGVWDGVGIVSGNLQTEMLVTNGFFEYPLPDAGGSEGSRISIFAAGSEGEESMDLVIGGAVAQTFNDIGGDAFAGEFVRYDFTTTDAVAIDDIEIRLTNDLYDPIAGIDRNLRVDRIVVDGIGYETESPTVFSTGTWQDGEITPGFKQDETLHTNGSLFFGGEPTDPTEPGVVSLETSNLSVAESAGTAVVRVQRTGSTDGVASVQYRTIADTATAGEDYQTQSGTLTFESGDAFQEIVIVINDDSDVEGVENFNVTIDNPNGATLLAPRTATVAIIDDEVSLPGYANFDSTVGLTLNGDAQAVAGRIELTVDDVNQAGSVFFDSPIDFSADQSFRTQFEFAIGGDAGGADGLAFVIQNAPSGPAALGGPGGRIGYDGIPNAIAVEFDNFRNSGWDLNGNHVSITSGGVVNDLRTVTPAFDLNDGRTYTAWVDYNGTSDALAVYLSDTADRPELALLRADVDLSEVIGTSAYVGFTAGTGGLTNIHSIESWILNDQTPPQNPPTQQGSDVVAVDVVTDGIGQPTAIEWLPDGTMLIAEKGGLVKTAAGGEVSVTPFLDIRDIVNGTRDRGLLDIAVHPDFESNPYVYLLFTYDPPEVFDQADGTLGGPDGKGNRAGRLVRVTADVNDGYRTAVEGSEVVLLGSNSTWENFNGLTNSTFDFDEPPAGENLDGTYLRDFINSDSESHTVGGLAFGVEGELFVSIGDGASYNRVDVRADRVQDIDSLSGKILRIDPITGEGLSDNPFFNGDADANRSKVYQMGLRNPFRISVDPVSGQLYVGDVGWSRWEEINSAGPGANFGWPFFEGANGTNAPQNGYLNSPEGVAWQARGETVTPSIYALSHQADGINAIVMGDAYRGSLYGDAYQGDVFFNDLGQGIVRHASIGADGSVIDVNTFTTGANVVVAISEGPDGALYYVDLDDSEIGRWELV